MGDWLAKMMSRVKSVADPRGSVREAMHAALRNRCKVYLEAPDQGIVALTQVQQITDTEVVIAQPAVGGATYPLAFGETLKLSFVDQRSNLTGCTRCLGRVKVPSGDGRTLFAYRLALPERLSVEERRAEPRSELAAATAPAIQLYGGVLPEPIAGTLSNISMTGARISIAHAPPRRMAVGEEIYLKLQMPDPVGVVDEVVQVQRLEFDRRSGSHTIGVSFSRRLEPVAELMRMFAANAPASGTASQPAELRRKSA